MSEVLVVTGSAREGSVNSVMVAEVAKNLEAREGVEVKIADLAAMDLPFMSAAMPPSSPDYKIDDPKVQAWSQDVTDSDAVVFVAPEYNHNISAVQKNAVDWLWKEWQKKPAAFVGYGAYGAKYSYAAFKEMNNVLGLDLGETITGVTLGQTVGYDGSIADEGALKVTLDATLDELTAKL